MTNNKELEAGLKAMAEDFHLPAGGRKKLSQLVAGHLHWFDAAERRGMGWRDMIRALTAAGVTGRGGKPLTVGTLSATVWRKRAEVQKTKASAGRHARHAPPEPASLHFRPSKETKRPSAGQPPRSKRNVGDQAQDSRQSLMPSKHLARETQNRNTDVLAFMERARAVRRRSD
jgi:hypothetical protein